MLAYQIALGLMQKPYGLRQGVRQVFSGQQLWDNLKNVGLAEIFINKTEVSFSQLLKKDG